MMSVVAVLSTYQPPSSPPSPGLAPVSFNPSFDPAFVLASLLLAFLGALATLTSFERIRVVVGRRRWVWLAMTGIALGGGGIWSAHVVAILGIHVPPGVSLAWPESVVALVLSIGGSTAGVAAASGPAGEPVRTTAAGLGVGIGLGVTHYIGMTALRTGGTVGYNPLVVVCAVVLAELAGVLTVELARRVRGPREVLTASAAIATVTTIVIYTALLGTRVRAVAGMHPAVGSDAFAIAGLTSLVSSIVMIFILFAAASAASDQAFRSDGPLPARASRPRRARTTARATAGPGTTSPDTTGPGTARPDTASARRVVPGPVSWSASVRNSWQEIINTDHLDAAEPAFQRARRGRSRRRASVPRASMWRVGTGRPGGGRGVTGRARPARRATPFGMD